MKTFFPGYYRLNLEESAKLWESCLFVADTSVLLNLYRYSPSTSTLLLDIFRQVQDRLWIPYQVAQEYQRNRLNVISQQLDAYDDIQDFLQKSFNQFDSKINSYRRHPHIDAAKIQSILRVAHKKISTELEKSKQLHPDLFGMDDIQGSLTQIFENKVGEPPTEVELATIYKEGDERYKKNIPPGYMDAKSKEGERRFGDLVLWMQVIKKAQAEQRPVILITDDAKEDWWWKFKGKTVGPHPELVAEFQQKVGSLFYMYRSDQFMEYARRFLSQKVAQEAINEVKGIRQLDETMSDRRNKLLAEMAEMVVRYETVATQITDLYVHIGQLRKSIEQASDEPENSRATKVLPLHEELAALTLQADSLIAVREESRRVYERLQEEIQHIEQQHRIVRDLDKMLQNIRK